MSTLCAITGTLRDLTGTVLPNTQVTFVRSGVAGQDGSTIVPRIVRATSDSSGVLAVTLYAGNYTATTVGADTGIVTFSVAVPAQATAVLSDLIDAAPTTVTPQAVLDAQAARDAAAASATTAATKATEAEGWANASAASAASAASVVQQDLSAFSAPMTYNPVDVVVGRMADWSDGGFNMRVIQPRTSWYNETLAAGNWLGEAADETAARNITGAGTGSYYHNTTDGKFYSLNATSGQTEVFRGNKAGFPEEYVVVAEAGRVIIFDATDPSLPMWMVFVCTGNKMIYQTNLTSIDIYDGSLLVGSPDNTYYGFGRVNFLADYAELRTSSAYYDLGRYISNRNSTPTAVNLGSAGAIVNAKVNDVAITVLPDAPIDPATGMPVPTIAVATDGGVSIIRDDGTVTDSVSTISSYAVSLHGPVLTSTVKTNVDIHYVRVKDLTDADVAADGWGFTIYASNTTPALLYLNSGSNLTPSASLSNAMLSAGCPAGVTLIHHNGASYTQSMVNYLTTTYLSGWMPGDIRGAWLADTTAETITGAELVTNGTFDTDVSGWTIDADVVGNTATWNAGGYVDLDATAGASGSILKQTVTGLTAGKSYVFSFDILSITGTLNVWDSGTSVQASYTTTGTKFVSFTAGGTSAIIDFKANNSTTVAAVDNISIRLADPDRSVKNNGLQAFGSIVKTPVATGADLVAYSGFSATNYLQQPYNPDLDFGTGDFCVMGWVKLDTINIQNPVLHRASAGSGGGILVRFSATTNKLDVYLSNTTAFVLKASSTTAATTGVWVFVSAYRRSGTLYVAVNGDVEASVSDATDITLSGAITRVGLRHDSSLIMNGSIALLRIGATAPSADQIKHIYETEKVLFQDNAKCTLYGSSDAVTDMAYDEITGKLGVLTSSGLSSFDGLRRVSEQAGTFSKVAMNNGLEALI